MRQLRVLLSVFVFAFCGAGPQTDLIAQLDSGDAAARADAARQLVSRAELLPKTSLPQVIAFANRPTPSRIAPPLEKKIREIPTVGDETPLVRVKAMPRDFIEKPFYLCGKVSIDNYFNYRYSESADQRYSLRLMPLAKNGESIGNDDCHVYALRTVAAPLADSIAAREAAGASGLLVRVRVTLLAAVANYEIDRSWNLFELLDWQYLCADGKTWTPSPFENGRLVRDLIRKLPDDSSREIVDSLLNKQVANGDAIEAFANRLVAADKLVRQDTAKHVRQIAINTKDKSSKALAVKLAKAIDPKPVPKSSPKRKK